MKKQILSVVIGIMALTLIGCADYQHYAEGQSNVMKENKALVASYFGASAARDGLVMSTMKEDSSAAVLYAVLQGQRDAQVINSFKGGDLKAPTTGMDVANTFFGETLGTVARWGFGYLIAGDLIDALGAGVTVGGDYINTTNTVDTGGGTNWNDWDYTTYDAGDDVNIESLNTTNN
jgi:hypothetical protein